MTATILTFPTDRCRRPALMIAETERAAFEAAAEEYAARPADHGPVCEMMRLACEGECLTIRLRASDWLEANCSLSVVNE